MSLNYPSDIRDTIQSVKCVPTYSISGIRVYKMYDNDKYDEGVFLSLLSGNKEDSLIVFMDINPDDFSLGGPYNQESAITLRKKFDKYKESTIIYQDRMDVFDNEDCAPYFFTVNMGEDTILYMSDLSKQNYYGFEEAHINEAKFKFRDYEIGKHLKSISIGNILSDDIISKINHIEILPCCDFNLSSQNKWKYSASWNISIYLEGGVIQKMKIFNIDF